MTQQVINIGSAPNDGTGDPLRSAFQKTNGNFTELYSLVVGGGLVPIPNNTLLGNVSGATNLPIAVTSTQLTALVNTFTSVLQGVVPASGGGTLNYLRADGTWAQPPIPGGTPLTPIGNNQVLGNISGGAAIPIGLNTTALTTLVNPFTQFLSGAVPASGGGTTNFLRADGTFAPSGAAILTQRGATWSQVGSALTTGAVLDVSIVIPQDSIITRATILTKGGPGSCQADIWATPIGAYPPTVANSIVGGNYPNIVAGNVYDDSTLAGWSTSLPQNSTVTFHLNSTSSFTEIVLMISLARTNVTNITGYTDGQAFSAVANSLSNSGNVQFTVAGGAISANTSAIQTWGPFSIGSNGYVTFPIGTPPLIMQWGNFSASGTPLTVQDFAMTFPHAFPTNCFTVTLTTSNRNIAGQGQAGTGSNYVSNITKTGCTVTIDSHSNTLYSCCWIAIGN